jgi:glycosyltransferase involved in cell wall biosynthesis
VFLSHVARLSGAEIGLVRFVEAADAIQATAILAEDGPLADALRGVGANVEVLPLAPIARDARRAQMAPGADQALAAAHLAGYVLRLATRLRFHRPDIVHTISLKAGVYGSLAARVARRTVLWHLHDHLSDEYLPPRVARVMRLLATTLPHALAAPSRSCLTSVGPGAQRLPTAIFPFPTRVPDEAATIREQVRCAGIVGRITPWKGQDVFLRGFASAFPSDGTRARVIGSALFGEHDFERQLRSMAADLGIAERVDFVGFRSDVGAELRQLDLLVHASTLADPMPTVIQEGLAYGVPTIAADAGGHAEYLRETEAGLLYRAGDAEALAQALRRAAGDPALRLALHERGRRRAHDFAPASIVPQITGFYDTVLAGRGGSP